jgi:hypothetical protein
MYLISFNKRTQKRDTPQGTKRNELAGKWGNYFTLVAAAIVSGNEQSLKEGINIESLHRTRRRTFNEELRIKYQGRRRK